MTIKAGRSQSKVFAAVMAWNRGREAQRVAMKYAKMAQNPFIFLRGACHLFYATLPDTRVLRQAPLAWCCGDAHFENFGGYKGNNRLVYFDINDFDEAALAPSTWDIVRLLTSIHCGADVLGATAAEADAAVRSCLQAYRRALREGKPMWVERDTSTGMVSALLGELRQRERVVFLDRRTERKGAKRAAMRGAERKLRVDGVKMLPVSKQQRSEVTGLMKDFAAQQPDPAFYRVLDVARRIAGTGSLGLTRYVLLVRGNGSPDANYLLEIKQCRPSALEPRLQRYGIRQPRWKGDAQRVASIQKRMQAVEHAFLHPVRLGRSSCTLKELQPTEDRVAIASWGGKIERLTNIADTMGRVLAWDQLRSCGRSGAASADELIKFAERSDFTKGLLDAAEEMTRLTREQWREFAAALKQQGDS